LRFTAIGTGYGYTSVLDLDMREMCNETAMHIEQLSSDYADGRPSILSEPPRRGWAITF